MSRANGEFKLTPEQRRVANAGPEQRTLVTAPAGTGKTATVVARLEHLVECGLEPGDDVLVLSFSRGAVREIRDRLRMAGGVAPYVGVRTFDSYASRFLSQISPQGPWRQQGYEGRIELCAGALKSIPVGTDDAFPYKHVIVDELQDVVGIRGELVIQVLRHCAGGFTLFGDPAQAIYNFHLPDPERRKATSALYTWIRKTYDQKLIEASFDENFRAQSEIARSVLPAGPRLVEPKPDFAAIQRDLVAILDSCNTVQFDDVKRGLKAPGKTTAILCRTNGQALVLSNQLFDEGIAHQFRRAATERAIAPWVGRALVHMDRGVAPRRVVVESLSSAGLPEDLDPDQAWLLLKRLDKPRRRLTNDLDLATVADRLSKSDIPDEIGDVRRSALVVSTIHRAKGLEFDRVIVVEPDDAEDDPMLLAEETRTLYVALTRPKVELMQMKAPRTWGLRRRDDLDRWTKKGKADWQWYSLEVRGEDAHEADPAGAFVLDEKAGAVQDYLSKRVSPGDEITLSLIDAHWIDDKHYAIEHRGKAIGVTSRGFGGTLFRLLKISPKWRVNWPVRIENLHIDTVDSVAGTEAAATRAGLSSAGIWLRARPFGLGQLVFEKGGHRR